jgi:hypothetical protein
MPPTALETSFSISITSLGMIAIGALLVIIILLVVMNSKLSKLSAELHRKSHVARPESNETAQRKAAVAEVDESKDDVEVSAGTHFEEFLNEDPERYNLTKKEKFKAYRAWRAEKGLNWKQ